MATRWFANSGTSERHRPVLLHYHFFKNAGTTIESILKQNFRRRLAHFDSEDHNAVISNEELLLFLEQHSEVLAVTSHHLRPPKPQDERFAFYDILFLRHPVARLWSTYEFYRRMDQGNDPLAAAAQNRSAPDFFALLMDDYPGHASNAQTNLIANAGGVASDNSALSRAIERSLGACVLGTAELFDESAVTAEQALQNAFLGLDFSYVAQNLSTGRVTGLEAQLERFADKCGQEMFDRLMQVNSQDLALHKAASDEVARRFSQVPKAGDRLQRLRSRCRQRSEGAATIIIASNHPQDFAFCANSGHVESNKTTENGTELN